MSIAYKMVDIKENGKITGFSMKFQKPYDLLEEFFAGEMPSFGDIVYSLVEEVVGGKESRTFSGNIISLEIGRQNTVIEHLIFEDVGMIVIATEDFWQLVKAYEDKRRLVDK